MSYDKSNMQIPTYKGYEIHILKDSFHTVSVTIVHTATVRAKAREIVDIRVNNPIDYGIDMIEKIIKDGQ